MKIKQINSQRYDTVILIIGSVMVVLLLFALLIV